MNGVENWFIVQKKKVGCSLCNNCMLKEWKVVRLKRQGLCSSGKRYGGKQVM